MNVILSYVYFATFFLLLCLALYGSKHDSVPGARMFSLLCIALSIHAGGYGFELLADNVETMMIWIRVEYIGCSFYPLLIMLFVRDYTGEKRLVSKIFLSLLALINVATLVIINTNSLHGLFYASTAVDNSAGFPMMSATWGIWYIVQITAVYSVLIVAVVAIIAKLRRTKGKSRRKNVWVLVGFLIPMVSAVVYHSQWGAIKIDFVPLSFLLMSFLIVIGLARYKVSFLSEITHEVIFGYIEEAIVVVDTEGYIIETNKAACIFFPDISDARPGDRIDQFESMRPFWERQTESQFEYMGKFFRARTIPIENFNGNLLVFTDVTEYMLIRKQLEFNATTDLLTGLYNRRYFMEYFKKITRPGCIAFIDLDDFKVINDTLGHLSGDTVLSDFGSSLKLKLPNMLACKYGGDEFIIVQQDITLAGFKRRIHDFASEYKKQAKASGFSFSVGIAEYVPGDFEASVASTDRLLYQAKLQGKNRIASSDGEVIEIKGES